MSDTHVNFDTDPDVSRRGYRLAQTFGFTLGGQEFELRHGLFIGSTALDEWWPVLKRMQADDEDKPTWAEHNDGAEWRKVDDEEFIAVWRRTMLNLLTPGQEEKLDAVLDPNRLDPLMLGDAVDVVLWAVPVVVGRRPTEASSASSNGSTAPSPEPGATSSTGDSSSPAAAASQTSPSESSAT